jgi:predicted naringenin-chalcone synthase
LNHAGCPPEEIDAVIISTCTGYLCPGLTSYVSEKLGLRQNIFALDLVGQGCGAALPNLRDGRGDSHRRSRQKSSLHLRRSLQRRVFYG